MKIPAITPQKINQRNPKNLKATLPNSNTSFSGYSQSTEALIGSLFNEFLNQSKNFLKNKEPFESIRPLTQYCFVHKCGIRISKIKSKIDGEPGFSLDFLAINKSRGTKTTSIENYITTQDWESFMQIFREKNGLTKIIKAFNKFLDEKEKAFMIP